MEIRIENRGGVQIVSPNAPLADGNEEELLASINALLGQQGQRLVLDMRDVASMNSSGLSVLVQLAAKTNLSEGRMAIARPNQYVAGVLELTKLSRFFEVFPEVEDACRAMEQRPS
ncbi:MAG: STAS domain-containing protein [Phycisphaerae bacterium]